MHDEHVKAGKAIQQATGKTFHLATRLLPERIRHPTYVLYGFFRIADDVVDDPDGIPPAEQASRLDSLREQALGEADPTDPVLGAFADLCDTHGIDDEWVNEFVDAMAADIETDRYETYADLAGYMRGSAAAVGVMMTDIMDLDDGAYERALPRAIALGEAFQLSNFVRDVHEDVVDRDRVYLPVETLEKHGATVEDVKELESTPEIRAAIAEETRRADALYRDGVKGIKFLPEDCQLAVLLAAVLYAEHHRVVRNRNYDTVSEDVDLPTWRKLWCLLKTRWHWQWTRDPEVVFERVAAVPTLEEDPADVPRDRSDATGHANDGAFEAPPRTSDPTTDPTAGDSTATDQAASDPTATGPGASRGGRDQVWLDGDGESRIGHVSDHRLSRRVEDSPRSGLDTSLVRGHATRADRQPHTHAPAPSRNRVGDHHDADRPTDDPDDTVGRLLGWLPSW